MNYSNLNYLIGKKINMLEAVDIERVFEKKKKNQYTTMIRCKCECGNTTLLFPYQFINGLIKSCGCIKTRTPYNATHKLSKTNLYHIWETMRLRCNSSKNKKYYSYGARGIKVCDEWNNNFLAFREWSLNNGYSKGLSLDRIDNNGNYESTNCRWTTRKCQQRNRRNTIYITYNNETKSLSEWCEILNLNYKTISNRIYSGWDKIKALTTPIKNRSI